MDPGSPRIFASIHRAAVLVNRRDLWRSELSGENETCILLFEGLITTSSSSLVMQTDGDALTAAFKSRL